MLLSVPYALFLVFGAVPLILFLHSLRPRGLKISTTALFIWERVLKERPLATRLGWLLRKNLLLILQVLAAILLIAALADPSLLNFGAPAGDTVVVMDLTASMEAKGPAGTRFEAARRELLSLVDALPAERKMMLIGAGFETRLIVPFTADKKRLREAARSIMPSDTSGNVKDAILFAHAFLKKGSPDRVVVISDGAFAGAEEFSRPPAHLSFIKVAGGAENTGIVGLDLRRNSDGSERYEVMAQVRNFGTKAVRAPFTLKLEQTVLAREEIRLEAGGRRVLVYPYEGYPAGTLTAQLEIDDDLATDNRAALVLNPVAPLRILYVGPGNPFLSNLLRFFPNAQVTAADRWEADSAQRQGGQGSAYDVMIFDRVTVPELTEGNVILIDTVAPNLPLSVQGEARLPRISAPLAKHPVTAGLTLSDLHVQESLRVAAAGDSIVLARGTNGPLLVAFERAKLRALFIGFDLMASDLPLRVAFPVLFNNVFEWFHPQRREFPADGVRAGTPFSIFIPQGDTELEIIMPSGRKERLEVVRNPVVFGDTSEAGLYRYKSSSREGRFTVNLFDEEESDIGARVTATAKRAAPLGPELGAAETRLSLWPFLLAAVFLLLTLELILAYRMRLRLAPVALRACAFAALALAWFNPKFFQAAEALDVIFGVDLSRSVGQEGQDKARELLEAAAHFKDADTRTGLFTFARAPEWEFPPRRTLPGVDFAARLDRQQTNIEAALQAGLAQIGDGRQGKLLLISDGNENRGTATRVLPLLRSQGTQVWTLPVSLARGRNEVFLSDLTLPRQIDSAEAFEVAGKIESLRDVPARVKLLRDGVLIGARELQLKAGVNEIGFHDSLSERGSHSYELLVESSDDTLAENNVLQGVVEVKGPPKVLLLSSQPQSQRFLAGVLRVQGFAVVESAPEADALALPELSSYDLLILDNVPAFQLTYAKMENIEKYVRDLGGGLFVIGGSQSYGAGGYFRTPLERILPVEMRPPARLDLPHVALLFVLDKSGSMGAGPEGGTKLDLAKAAAIAAADIMNPTDQIGILAFDAGWDWALPFRPVGKGEWITDKLAALQSDGGTDMYKAMVEARSAIAGKDAAIKHVIVLSDGLTDKADFQSLVQQFARAGVTVSTVSVGDDADVKLMAEIARVGKGRGYVALDPQTIPQIFTTETLLISRDLLIEKTIAPRVVAPVGPLRGIAQSSLPQLRGYVLTYPKPRSEVLMKAGEDPLLVAWRHGLGRVMAFTSDLSGRWGKAWVAWQGLPQWAGQLARDTMRKILETHMRAEFYPDGDTVKVIADFIGKDGKFMNHLQLRGNVTAPNRSTQQSTFHQSGPGRYEGEFTPAERGIHFLTIFAAGNTTEAPLAMATISYVAPYPKEYRKLSPNVTLLSRLAEETGGEMLDPENFETGLKQLYTPSPGKAARAQETWWPLAGAGLILFLIDLVMRSWPQQARIATLGEP
jgi:Ca-activated chloride channel homolog